MDRMLLASLGLLLIAAPSRPAVAQLAPLPRSTLSFAKSEAILGGAPSRFAALMAQQNGVGEAVADPPASAAPVLASPVMAPPAFARLAFALPAFAFPVFATPASATPNFAVPATSATLASQLFRRAAAGDRPDVFGTVALAVRHTPLDRRWHAAEGQRASGAARRFAASLRAIPAIERLAQVNRFVNARVRFVDDSRAYGRADVWQGAADTLRRGRGDCEDYAIAKLGLLRAAGFAERDLYLVIVKDLVRRSDHAVLVARANDRLVLLDNGTDLLSDATAFHDYRPVLSYSAGRAWTHGYQLPTVTLASASAPARGVYR